MATVVRAEAVISAQNKLKPGLNSAVADLKRFQAQAKAAARMNQQFDRMDRVAGLAKAGVAALAGRATIGAVAATTVRFADLDRTMNRIGITGEASAEETTAGLARLRGLAVEVASPVDQLTQGLDALTSSGLSFKEAMDMMPSVARTAQASGAGFADIANSSLAAVRHLKIETKDLQLAQDMMAKGGQLGQFELKDMARYLPSIAPAAKAVGIEGTRGLARLVGMLQIVREGAGTSEEAATNFQNILQKMESEETVNKFEKMGVDLAKGMNAARKNGDDLFETFVKLTNKALKGDMSRLNNLFSDSQMQKGMRALLAGYGKLPGMVDEIGKGAGTVASNLKRITGDTKAGIDRLSESADRAKTAFGGLVGDIASPAIKTGADNLSVVADHLERIRGTFNKDGATAAVKHATAIVVDGVKRDYAQHNEDWQTALDDKALTGMAARNRKGGETADVTRSLAWNMAQTPSRRAEIEAQERKRAAAFKPTITREETNAFSRQQLRMIGPAPDAPDMSGVVDDAREARKGRGFAGAGKPVGGKLVDAPMPPIRPDNGAIREMAQGFEMAASKADDAKTAVIEIGPAAQTASQQMAASFNASIDAMIAKTETLQQKLNSLKAPSLSFGGGSGFNVGKSMPEVR
jgi:TP901 family phage tail tape measure protein